MLQTGRNDPCPCGSGKKFKNCCMRQALVQRSRETGLGSLELLLLRDLARFVAQPRYASDLAEGMAIFWGARFSEQALAAMDVEDGRRFVEWFVLDFRLTQEKRPPIELFLEREGPRYAEEARQLLSAWADSTMAMLRYLRRVSDDRLAVQDALRETEYEVVSRPMATNARSGDVLVGRVYELEGVRHLSVNTLLLPPEFEQPLAEYLRNAYRLYGEEHPGADVRSFLRRHGHILHAFLLSERAQALRGLIGPGTRFYDPALTRDRMREIERAQRLASGGPDLLTLGDVERRLPLHRTGAGIVLPGMEPEQAAPEEDTTQKSTILIPGRDT